MRLLYSSRTLEDVIYRAELDEIAPGDGVEVVHTLTRAQPDGWTGYSRRVDAELLREVAWPAADERRGVRLRRRRASSRRSRTASSAWATTRGRSRPNGSGESEAEMRPMR